MINNRNKSLPDDIKEIQIELQKLFQKNILSAGVLQPGYFSDFFPILEEYKNNKKILRYHISEEEYVDDGSFFKIPVIDILKPNEQSNIRIFLTPNLL